MRARKNRSKIIIGVKNTVNSSGLLCKGLIAKNMITTKKTMRNSETVTA